MADVYRIIGAEMSPYSVKVRSYFRYKGIPHQWVLRNAASQAEFEKYAKMPIIPLVVTPDGTGIQDSTPIIDRIEKLHPEPSIHPDDPVANFVSSLIEEFGDEICDVGNLPKPLGDLIRNACIKSHRCFGHAGDLSQVRFTQPREICNSLVIRLAVSIKLKQILPGDVSDDRRCPGCD